MLKKVTILIVSLILLAGCTQQTQDTGGSSGNVETYTVQEGTSTTIIEANENEETYTLSMDSRVNLSEMKSGEMYSTYTNSEIIDEMLTLSCGLMQQICYNFSTLESANNIPLIQQVPNEVWTSYEPESVEITLYDTTGSEEYGSCEVNPGSISKENLISGEVETEETESDETVEVNISSLDLKLDDEGFTYRYRARDWNTDTPDLRIDVSSEELPDTSSVILNSEEETAWIISGNYTQTINFTQKWNEYYSSLQGLIEDLHTNPNCLESPTCTLAGNVTLYDININPTLEDSTFQG